MVVEIGIIFSFLINFPCLYTSIFLQLSSKHLYISYGTSNTDDIYGLYKFDLNTQLQIKYRAYLRETFSEERPMLINDLVSFFKLDSSYPANMRLPFIYSPIDLACEHEFIGKNNLMRSDGT